MNKTLSDLELNIIYFNTPSIKESMHAQIPDNNTFQFWLLEVVER